MNTNSQTPHQTVTNLLPLAQAGDMNAVLELAKLYLAVKDPTTFKWAKVLSDNDRPEGFYLLGKCYEQGIRVDKDLAKAESLYRKSADMGFPRALTGLVSLLLAAPEKRSQNTPTAIRLLKQAVAEGDEKAMFVLSFFYKEGNGVAFSPRKQGQLLYEAANKGFVPAMTDLGEILMNENLPFYDYDDGLNWIRKAADLGDDKAQHILSRIEGKESVESSHQAAEAKEDPAFDEFFDALKAETENSLKLNEKMVTDAEAGIAEAEYQLGLSYFYGKTQDGMPVEKNTEMACQWLEKAAAQGHILASYHLGRIAIEDGQDFKSAVKWLVAPAAKGVVEAMAALSYAYLHLGEHKSSFTWAKKAAELGDAEAIGLLACHYYSGWAVEADINEAIRLFSIAADKDDDLSCLELGKIYLTEKHFDLDKAEELLVKGANFGNPIVQTELALIYLGAYDQSMTDYDLAWDLLAMATSKGYAKAAYLLGTMYHYIYREPENARHYLEYSASLGYKDAINLLEKLFPN